MRMKTTSRAMALAFAWLVGAFASAYAQDIPQAKYPDIPKSARSAEGFVPKGWQLETQIKGDLNNDGAEDLVLVLHEQNNRNVIKHEATGGTPLDTNPRTLVIAFAQPDGSYVLVAKNHALIPRHTDPHVEDWAENGNIFIKRGTLQVSVHFFASMGSWTMSNTTYTFRWQRQRFELIGYDYASTNRNSGDTENLSVNYSTRKVKRTRGSIDTDATKVTWEALPAAPMLSIDDFHGARPGFGESFVFDPIKSKVWINMNALDLGA